MDFGSIFGVIGGFFGRIFRRTPTNQAKGDIKTKTVGRGGTNVESGGQNISVGKRARTGDIRQDQRKP